MFLKICRLFHKIHSSDEVTMHYDQRNACHTVFCPTMPTARGLSRSFLTLCGVWAIQLISNVLHIPLHAPHLFTTLEAFGPRMPKCLVVIQGNRKLQIIARALDTSHDPRRLFATQQVSLSPETFGVHTSEIFMNVCKLCKRVRSAFVAADSLNTASQREATDWNHVLWPLPRGRNRIRNSLPFSFAHLGPIPDSV